MLTRELAQQMRQENSGVVVGATKPDRPRQSFSGEIGQRFVVHSQDALRVNQQAFAGIRQYDSAPRAPKQRLVHDLLETLHLLTQCRLGSPDTAGRPAESTNLCDNHERSQQIDVERKAQGIRLASMFHKNYSIP